MTTTTKTAVISQPMKGASPEQVAHARAERAVARAYGIPTIHTGDNNEEE